MDAPLELEQSPPPDAQAPDDAGPAVLLALAALTKASEDLRAAIQQMNTPTAPTAAADLAVLAPESDGRRADALPVFPRFGDDLPTTPAAPTQRVLAPESDGRRADALPVFPRFGDDLPTTPAAPTQRVLAPEEPAPVFNITINISTPDSNPQAVAAAAQSGVLAAARRLGLA